MSDKKLVRKQNDKLFLGVASGVADYIGIDPVIVRLIFVLLTLWHGWGLLIYYRFGDRYARCQRCARIG